MLYPGILDCEPDAVIGWGFALGSLGVCVGGVLCVEEGQADMWAAKAWTAAETTVPQPPLSLLSFFPKFERGLRLPQMKMTFPSPPCTRCDQVTMFWPMGLTLQRQKHMCRC